MKPECVKSAMDILDMESELREAERAMHGERWEEVKTHVIHYKAHWDYVFLESRITPEQSNAVKAQYAALTESIAKKDKRIYVKYLMTAAEPWLDKIALEVAVKCECGRESYPQGNSGKRG